MRPSIVFVHGWGTNSGIWTLIKNFLQDKADIYLFDMPGYGEEVMHAPTDKLRQTAEIILQRAPQDAIWVGWSLGGMVAMHAALLDKLKPRKIKALQILCSTPRFVRSHDWPHGMELDVFQGFSDDLVRDYQGALRGFLLLQAGKHENSRQLAKQATEAMSVYPQPSELALSKGIEYLRDVDLRSQISEIDIPVQIVAGQRDRLSSAQASEYMAKHIPQADLHVMPTGHAPFLTDMSGYTDKLMSFVGSIA